MRVRRSLILKVFVAATLLSVASYMTAQVSREVDMVPTGKGWGVAVDQSNNNNGQVKGNAGPGGAGPKSCTNGICYNGGPVMGGNVPVYYIWYGSWTGNTAPSLLSTLVSDLGGGTNGSSYMAINTTYSINGTPITGQMSLLGSANDSYSQGGTTLTDSGVKAVVSRAITNGLGPAGGDPSAIYFVLTSADVNESSGFCTQYCGWHTHGSINGKDIKYSFVGNPDRCPNACAWQTTSPNGNAGADGMASIIAHEAEEAISDPDLNAWYDRRGYENADKCAWTFGTTQLAGGAEYNFVGASGLKWLIQRNWVNRSGGYCSMTLP